MAVAETENYTHPIPVEKKIAMRFRTWLRKHPKATHEEKVEKFDKISDELTGR